jgi:ADP-ribose pyrophosphatase
MNACLAEHWKLTSRAIPVREIKYIGKKIQVALETSVAADGQAVTRDVVIHPGAVAILPLLDEEHVCLLRNRRPNVGATLIEIPAGTLEPGEAPEVAAPRELAEETGYRAASWRKLAEFYPSPGVLSEKTHLFVAQALTPGVMRPERDEELEPFVVAWRQALAWCLDSTIRDAKTLAALLLWDRTRLGE